MNTREQTLPITVVIPTYCEEKTLPILLKSIANQVLRPEQIIVADAQSTDKTRELARAYGARVVEGGAISVGRNNGAREAQTPYLLFMDADTELPSETAIAEAFLEFLKKDLDIASVGFWPMKYGATPFGFFAGTIVFRLNSLIQRFQSFIKKIFFACGAFVFVKKEVFDELGGFDQDLITAEDSDFFRRATELKKRYGHLKLRVYTSTRRYDSVTRAVKMAAGLWLVVLILSAVKNKNKKLSNWTLKSYGRLGGGAGVTTWKDS